MNKKSFLLFALLFAIAVVVFLCAYGFFLERVPVPNDTNDNTNNSNNTVIPGDNHEIYNSINGAPSESTTIIADLTDDTVKQLLSEISLPESFAWYYNSTLYSSKKSIYESGNMFYGNGNFRIDIYDQDGNIKKSIVEDNDTVTVTINDVVREFLSSTTPFEEAGVPAVEDFIDNPHSFEYSLVESDYGAILYAEFINSIGSYSQIEQYYISLDYGIVVRADCYDSNGNIFYSLSTTSLHELETIN